MGSMLYGAFIALAFGCVSANLAIWSSNKLQPVQGLYVKPSSDGSTGDLYVAATEDSGVNAQWVADQPINFLPQSTIAPAFAAPEETVHKRSIFTNPALKYANAQPAEASTTPAQTYPYATTAAVPTEGALVQYSTEAAQQVPYQQYSYPYNYNYFPYLMSAVTTSGANALKELGVSEEVANAVLVAQSNALWSAAALLSYPTQYPYNSYVSVDPAAAAAAWAQHQAAVAATPATATNLPTPAEAVQPL